MSNPICQFATSSSPLETAAFSVAVYAGFFFFDYILVPLCSLAIGNRILPDKARRNVVLNMKDHVIVQMNRLVTVLFLYHMTQLSCNADLYSTDALFSLSSPFSAASLRSIAKTLAIFAVFFPVVIVVYDFFYAIFHRILHIEWLYPYIHKHHHLQYTPWRGNVDAINTHPIEYILGEYNHLWALFLVGRLCVRTLGYKPHASFILLYIVVAGLLSTLNHTRIDVRIPYIYNVWWHDLHHRNPPTNYGQYTMIWDYIFGWYKEESTKTIADEYNNHADNGEMMSSNNNNNTPIIPRQSALANAFAIANKTPAAAAAKKRSTSAKRGSSSSSKKKTTTRSASPKKKASSTTRSSSKKKK